MPTAASDGLGMGYSGVVLAVVEGGLEGSRTDAEGWRHGGDTGPAGDSEAV